MRQLFILWMLLVANEGIAQKHDYIWLPGNSKIASYPFGNVYYPWGGMVMDFQTFPPSLKRQSFALLMYPQASISDKNGGLVAYTNGCHIANKNHEVMANGDTINPGLYQGTTTCLIYYPTYQGCLFLPTPGSDSLYHLFHIAQDYEDGGQFLTGQRYYYSVVDAHAANGAGKVIEKNRLLMQNGEVADYIAATKHANGRDWWVVSPREFENTYYTFLLTPNGISGPQQQVIGDSMPNINCCGQSLFSRDGSRYARCTNKNSIQIFDFDRCAGRLSNPLVIPEDSVGYSGPAGLAFSPSGRFLYSMTNKSVYQFDLEALNIIASKRMVKDAEFLQDPELGTFHHAQLAPDGKIYIVSLNYYQAMSVIHFPDRAGEQCQVVQGGLRLPSIFGNDLLFNFAHYRLGPLDGSPCDTLGLDNIPLANFRWEVEDTLAPLRASFTEVCSYETKTWHWSFGDGTTGSERHPVHDYARPGKYEVCLTAENANGSDKFCRTLFFGVVPAENPELERGIEALPNPFSETFALILNLDLPNPRLLLRDQYGRVCRQTALGLGFNEVDTATLPPGFYYWEVWSRGERVKAGKVIKG